MAVRWLSLYPDEHYRLTKELTKRNRYSRGKRDDLGKKCFRSSWEANYARYLNWLKAQNQIKEWEYESETFWFSGIRRGCTSYLPDFKVELLDGTFEYHELKGHMDNKSATKLKRMKKYHPKIRIVLVDKDAYRGIQRSAASLIPNWEYPDRE